MLIYTARKLPFKLQTSGKHTNHFRVNIPEREKHTRILLSVCVGEDRFIYPSSINQWDVVPSATKTTFTLV